MKNRKRSHAFISIVLIHLMVVTATLPTIIMAAEADSEATATSQIDTDGESVPEPDVSAEYSEGQKETPSENVAETDSEATTTDQIDADSTITGNNSEGSNGTDDNPVEHAADVSGTDDADSESASQPDASEEYSEGQEEVPSENEAEADSEVDADQTNMLALDIAPMSVLVESNPISSLFPDTVLAQYIAGLLGKSVSSAVTQNELNTITNIDPDGAIQNVQGLQYLNGLQQACIDNLQITQRIPEAFISDIYPTLSSYTANNQHHEFSPTRLSRASLDAIYPSIPPIIIQIAQNSGGNTVGTWFIRDESGKVIDQFDAVDGTELTSYTNVSSGSYKLELLLGSNIWMGLNESQYIFPYEYDGNIQGSISGTITSSAGVAIQGCEVLLKSGTTAISTTTDASGNYSFPSMKVGSNYVVTVKHPGYHSQAQNAEVLVGTNTVINFSMIPIGGSVDGLVIDAITKKPIVGAQVAPQIAGVAVKTTDESGRFHYTHVPNGEQTATISAVGYKTKEDKQTLAGYVTNQIVIELEPLSHKLHGYIYDGIGISPLVGATVSLPGERSAISDSEGYYEIDGVVPGTYLTTVSMESYSSVSKYITIQEEDLKQDFTLTQSSNIGTIKVQSYLDTTSEGNELEGVSIEVKRTSDDKVVQQDVTNASGEVSFTVDGSTSPGISYTLSASKPGYQIVTSDPSDSQVNVISSKSTTIQFALSQIKHTISGTVYEAENQKTPINGAEVTLYDKMTNQPVTGITTLVYSDINGQYSFKVPYGEYYVVAEKALYGSDAACVTIDENSGDVTKPLLLPTSYGTLVGRVYYADTITPVDGAVLTLLGNGRQNVTGTDGTPDGMARVNVAPGEYSATATYNGYTTPPKTGTVTSDGTTDLIFYVYEKTALTGLVIDLNTRKPVEGATVKITADGTINTTTENDGRYYFQNCQEEGPYTLEISAPGYQTLIHTFSNIEENKTAVTNFMLIPIHGALTGTVFYADGTPVPDATISLNNGNKTTTDATGHYYFIELAGNYVVKEYTEGYGVQTKPATIYSDTTTSVNFILNEPAGALEGTVTGAAGRLLPGVTITAMPYDSVAGGPYTATTDGNGYYQFPELAPEKYSVTASWAGYGSLTKEKAVLSQTTAVADFVLGEKPGILEGTVTYANSKAPVEGALITVLPDGIQAKTDKYGYYRILLVGGNYRVTMKATAYPEQSKNVHLVSLQTAATNFVIVTADTSTNDVGVSDTPPPDTIQTDAAQSGTTQTNGWQSNTTGTGTTQTNAKQTDAAQTDAKQTNAKQSNAAQSGVAQTNVAQTDSAQTDDATRTDPAQTDNATQTDAAQTDTTQSNAAQTDASQSDATQKSNPRTGNGNTLYLLLFMLSASAACLLIILYVKRQRRS